LKQFYLVYSGDESMAKKVLFLCTGNSARSQMAEGFLRHLAGDRYEAYSAGMEPKGLHPMTVQVMQEVGIDVSHQRSKGIKEVMGRMQFDDAIIVCRQAEHDCPRASADARRVHRWLFEDPVRAEGSDVEKLAKFREVRDQIEARIKLWLAETEEAERIR
jgi:arsenate reductase